MGLPADHYMEDLHNGFKFEAGERYGRMFLLYKNSKSEVPNLSSQAGRHA